MHHANQWAQHNHPDLIKLYGAYHIGEPYYFVHEDASSGTLHEFLRNKDNQQLKWQTLCEAALGLQYLHERGIVRGALTCDNILIGESGNAKLGGFKLQATVKYTTRRIDVHLKAPVRTGRGGVAGSGCLLVRDVRG